VAQVAAITGLDMVRAGEALDAADDDVERAVGMFFDASSLSSSQMSRVRQAAGPAQAGERCPRCNVELGASERFCTGCGLLQHGEAQICVQESLVALTVFPRV
jgi:membrane protease subunit (stomatin/prohibitin family)